MKPVRLILQAFGPYLEKTEVEFAPFAEAGIFLIAGPTGGGKTSLLDAMCFALYGQATGGQRRFGDMRCMSAPQELPTVVEFDFRLGAEAYRFHRELFYRQNRRTKELEPRESNECFILEEEGPRLLASGSDRAVTGRAEELLRLNRQQFSQVIVLPQGAFSQFLLASATEKGKILRTLFSAQIWERVTERFKDRAKALERDSRDAANRREALLLQEGAESGEALAEMAAKKAEELEKLAAEQNAGKGKLEAAEKRLRSAESFDRLRRGLEKAAAERDQARERLAPLEKAAAENQEKRKAAGEAQQKAEEAAGEKARLEGRLAELEKALRAGENAKEARAEREKREKERQALEGKDKELAGRMLAGEEYKNRCQEAAHKLPGLLAQRQVLGLRLGALKELDRRRTQLEAAGKALESAKKNARNRQMDAESLSQRLARQEALLRQDAALGLAGFLKEGEACPVCGSVHHPAPAAGRGGDGLMAPQDLDALRAREKAAAAEASGARALVQGRTGELERAGAALKEQEEAVGPGAGREETEKQLAEISAKAAEAKKLQDNLPKAQAKLDSLSQLKKALAQQALELNGEISRLEERAKALEEQARSAEKALQGATSPELKESIAQTESRRTAAKALAEKLRKEADLAENQLSRAQEAMKVRQSAWEGALAEFKKMEPDWPEPPDLAAIKQEFESLRIQEVERSQALGKAQERLGALKASLASVRELDGKLAALSADFGRVSRLSQGLSGDNPLKTPVLQYVLSVTLDEVLVSANEFFSRLSRGRYALRLKEGPKGGNAKAGLDLEVLDGASALPRATETLSGGEQFLAALSLAFGLSEVVQAHSGAVGLDSIFIDEGFGSLDGETLDTAMKALDMLRSGGRLIGVISHVQELQGRIGGKIQVSQDAQGNARARVII